MYGDIIECLNCGKTFKDTTNRTDKLTEADNTYQWKGQDSREGKFNNMCPFCYGTSTRNTHKKAKKMPKFINEGESIRRTGAHVKSSKRVKRPDLDTEHIRKEVLGDVQSLNIEEESYSIGRTQPRGELIKNEDFYRKLSITRKIAPVKTFTPIELMERKLEAQHKELLSPPDNFKRYKGWRYDKRLKK